MNHLTNMYTSTETRRRMMPSSPLPHRSRANVTVVDSQKIVMLRPDEPENQSITRRRRRKCRSKFKKTIPSNTLTTTSVSQIQADILEINILPDPKQICWTPNPSGTIKDERRMDPNRFKTKADNTQTKSAVNIPPRTLRLHWNGGKAENTLFWLSPRKREKLMQHSLKRHTLERKGKKLEGQNFVAIRRLMTTTFKTHC